MNVVGILVNDFEVVKNVAILFRCPGLPTPMSDGFERGLIFHRPSQFIDCVNGLLDDVVAGKPGEIEPIADLPFHVGPACLARPGPEPACIVNAVMGTDVADGAFVNFLEESALGEIIPPAKP